MKPFKRVYHPWDKWEEGRFNMWGATSDRAQMLERAILFTGDHEKYGEFMQRVIVEWPVSCENALTDFFLNRRAWLGHAACALALQCPEDITRKAWKFLTDEQRLLANREAARAIQQWEDAYRESKGIRKDLGRQMLFQWDT